MRNIFSFLTSALVLLAVSVACHPSEITNPDNPDPKGKSEITITASIIQTRVSYDCSDPGEVKQEWEVGDILFGFWGGSPSESNQIVFMVNGVDPDTGVATLEAVSGAEWIETATEGGTAVDLVYTGGVAAFTEDGISVDLSGQSLDRVPGCMHAQAALQEDEDGNKSLEFNFQNDCALIEIDGLTGIAESGLFGEDVSSLALSSVHITHLLLGGSYSFSNGELVFDSDEDSLEDDYAIELESGWTVGNDGAISGPDRKKILVAVAPNPEEKQITVSSKVSTGEGTLSPSFDYGKRSLAGGLCYVISAQPVVARTADGKCFKSVSAAFDHAAELSDQGYDTASKNVVTLIKKEIDGFGEQTASQTHMSSIDIYSNVTLDLNGCTLSLSGAEGFNVNYIDVNTPATFTITDSNGLNDDEEYEGKIKSTSSNPIIINYGDVIIDGGELYFTFSDKSYYERYCMIDNAGGSLTIGNDSYLQVDGTTPNNDAMYFLISSTGTLTVNSGSLNSYDVLNTIGNFGGTVTIHGGEVYSKLRVALYSGPGSTTIIDGKDALIQSDDASQYQAIVITSYETTKLTSFEMSAGKVEGAFSAVLIDGNVSANISGGYIKSNVHHTLCVFNESTSKELNPSCIITGGVIHNTSNQSSANSAVYCFTPVKGDDGNKNLVVKWATGNEGDSKEPEQPILFSNKMYPIFAEYYQLNNNFAQIEVSGGYLYSTRAQATRCFYDERDETGNDGYYCLTIPENSSIYTNTNYMYFGTRRQEFSNYTQRGGNTAVSITTKTISQFPELGSLSFTFCISTSSVSAPGEMSDYQHESLE